MGFEPTTSSMRPKRSSQLSYTPIRDCSCSGRSSPPTSPHLDGPLQASLEDGGGDVAARAPAPHAEVQGASQAVGEGVGVVHRHQRVVDVVHGGQQRLAQSRSPSRRRSSRWRRSSPPGFGRPHPGRGRHRQLVGPRAGDRLARHQGGHRPGLDVLLLRVDRRNPACASVGNRTSARCASRTAASDSAASAAAAAASSRWTARMLDPRPGWPGGRPAGPPPGHRWRPRGPHRWRPRWHADDRGGRRPQARTTRASGRRRCR